MSKSILGLIIILLTTFQLRAEQPIFNISSTDATTGQIIDIDFHVDNFSQIISVQYSVNWNPDVLKFRTIKNFNSSVPGLSPSVFGTPQAFTDAGKFTLAWIESNITPITIPDGSLFFTVEFEVVGDPCQNSTVAITNDPLEIEVAEVGEVLVGLVSNDGTVSIPGSGCTEGINIIGNSVVGSCGSQACVQFTLQNFDSIGVMQFSLVYDPALIQFNEFRNFAPLTGFNAGSTNLVKPGELRVVWTNSNVKNESLPDGTVLFEICFDVNGPGGQSSDISFGTVFPVLFSDIDGNEVPATLTPAVITAQCAIQGFALIADTVCTMPNNIACFNISVNDFVDIIAMQFSINWDSTVFTFDHVEGFTIPGLDASGFGTPPSPDVKQGQLTVSWIDLTLQGVTVPDLSTIFRLCLKAKGASGTSSPITFSANPIDIEIATIDSVLVYGLVNGKGEIKASCETGCNVSYTLTGVGPSCPRESNGSLNLTVFEDCPESPTYLWNYNNATTEDLSDIGAGTYTVTITVGPNVVIASITLTDPPPLGVTGTVIDPDPSGSATGAINITVTGGTPPYTFKWSAPPPGPTTEDLTNIFAGVYTVTVTDSKGCTFIPDPYVVGADVSAAVTDVTCNGGSDGAINLSVSFGTGPYTFSWNTVPVKTTEDISNLTARIYCVTITDNGGSTRDTCFTVAQPELLVVTGTVVNDINENCQGAIDLNVVGGTLPYSYKWSAPPPGPTSQDITQLCAGQYCVTVTDGNGCTATKCFTVFAGGINVSLVATQYGNFQTSCAGICDGDITSVVAGGSGTITYAWSNGATTPDLTSLCAGTYTVTVTDASAQTSSATIVISSPVAFTLSYIKTSPSDYITSDGAIAVVVNGGVPPYTYHWTGPASGNTAALNNVPAGTYTVVVTDANGCEVRDSEQLIPDGDVPCYKAITVITPNSDGKNDYFIIACVFDLDNHLYIFNRLGGLVYETNNYQNTWIGVDQDNEPVPDGGYLWVLEVYRTDGSTQLIKGTVNVLRTAD